MLMVFIEHIIKSNPPFWQFTETRSHSQQDTIKSANINRYETCQRQKIERTLSHSIVFYFKANICILQGYLYYHLSI